MAVTTAGALAGARSRLPNPAVTDTWAVLDGRNNEMRSHDFYSSPPGRKAPTSNTETQKKGSFRHSGFDSLLGYY